MVTGWHVGNLMESGEVEIVGVADPSEKARESLRRRQPAVVGVPEFECAEELYSSVEFDGVFVGTPHTMHYSHVMGAITKGAHVICEKPLACTPEHTREIAAEARARDLVVTVSYQRRLDGAYTYMRNAIDNGEIGDVQAVSITCGQNWRHGTAGSWRQDPALSGGGMLMDTGSHMIDVLLWLAGRNPQSVTAIVDHLGAPVDINSTATVRFEGDVQGQLTIIGDLPTTWVESVLVAGSTGLLRYENDPQHPWRTGNVCHFKEGGIHRPLDIQPWNPPTTDSLWLGAIRGRNPNPIPPEDSVRVADLTAAMYRSAHERLPQDLVEIPDTAMTPAT